MVLLIFLGLSQPFLKVFVNLPPLQVNMLAPPSSLTKLDIFIFAFFGSPLNTTEQLSSPNYLSWAAIVQLWFKGQGYENHLIKKATNVPTIDQPTWQKIDAQLCSLLCSTINHKLFPIFCPYQTCYYL